MARGRRGGGHEYALMADGQIRTVKRRQRKNIVFMVDSRAFSQRDIEQLLTIITQLSSLEQRLFVLQRLSHAIYVNPQLIAAIPVAAGQLQPAQPTESLIIGATAVILGVKKLSTKEKQKGEVIFFIDHFFAEFVAEFDRRRSFAELKEVCEYYLNITLQQCRQAANQRVHARVDQALTNEIDRVTNELIAANPFLADRLHDENAVDYLDFVVYRCYQVTIPEKQFIGYQNTELMSLPIFQQLPIETTDGYEAYQLFRQFKTLDNHELFERFTPDARFKRRALLRIFHEVTD